MLDKFGRVDGCFANAGIGGGGRKPFIERSEEEWRTMFATNLDGVFHAFQAAARHMTKRAQAGDPFGRLVATSSLASLFGTAAMSTTQAPKRRSTRCVARWRWSSRAMASRQYDPARLDQKRHDGARAGEREVFGAVMPRIPVRRFGEPSDFGGIAVYLMSEASSSGAPGRHLRDRRRVYGVLICSLSPQWRLLKPGRFPSLAGSRTGSHPWNTIRASCNPATATRC